MADTNNPPSSVSDVIPSSFDDSPEFFEEKRLQKLWRRLREEPLIPIGCAATVYALYQATKSIRAGDHHQTNRMFRARIYAQGFTLVAVVAGGIFYKDERLRRRRFESALEDKKAAEKRERWLRELETRDKEDREWRERFEGVAQRARYAEEQIRRGVDNGVAKAQDTVEKSKDTLQGAVDKAFQNKSVLEDAERSGWGRKRWLSRARDAWKRV